MTNLITEARELCEKWSLSDYAVFECEDCIANMVIYKVAELCDALEKAEGQNKQLVHEVCKLACESVKRDVALARLEAEVMAACNSVRWIPVTERLPTGCGYYLSVVKRIAPDELGGNNTRVKIMRWMGEDWRYAFHFPKWINDEITETVTHWQPFPPHQRKENSHAEI